MVADHSHLCCGQPISNFAENKAGFRHTPAIVGVHIFSIDNNGGLDNANDKFSKTKWIFAAPR